jgi:hypothetical protein
VLTLQEAALRHVLKEVQQSIDYLYQAGTHSDDSLVSSVLLRLANRRQSYLSNMRREIVSMGDFPSQWDHQAPDMQDFSDRSHAETSQVDREKHFLGQRVRSDQRLLDTIEHYLHTELSDRRNALLQDLAAHVSRSLDHLNEVSERLG